jgi:hypothetical protein
MARRWLLYVSYIILRSVADRQDSTFEFEKRRNVPVRYDRELVATTLKAMERVQEIKTKRENAFWKNRYVFNTSIEGCGQRSSPECPETRLEPVKKMLKISNVTSNSSNLVRAKTPKTQKPIPLPISPKRKRSEKRSRFERQERKSWQIRSSRQNPNLRDQDPKPANLSPQRVGWVCSWIRCGSGMGWDLDLLYNTFLGLNHFLS